MASAASTEPLSSGSIKQTFYPANRLRTEDYMYSILPVPRNPSIMLRFIYYATGAPPSAAYIVGKFPRRRVRYSPYGWDTHDVRYTDRGADIYWATTRGTCNIMRDWGVANGYYYEEEGVGETEKVGEAEGDGVIEEAAGTTSVLPEDGQNDDLARPDPPNAPPGSPAESPRMAGGRSPGEGSRVDGKEN